MTAAELGVAISTLALELVFTVYGWIRLPPDARVAIHWGIRLQPNTIVPKPVGLLIVPALTLVLSGIIATRTSVERPVVSMVCFGLLLASQALIVAYAVRHK
ncbi:MAG TPA: DUF1648 domain-containing protein [Actinomycetota bacterium]|nr:DUF1648 domain-containing protein [Actinomycetota bacterium]